MAKKAKKKSQGATTTVNPRKRTVEDSADIFDLPVSSPERTAKTPRRAKPASKEALGKKQAKKEAPAPAPDRQSSRILSQKVDDAANAIVDAPAHPATTKSPRRSNRHGEASKANEKQPALSSRSHVDDDGEGAPSGSSPRRSRQSGMTGFRMDATEEAISQDRDSPANDSERNEESGHDDQDDRQHENESNSSDAPDATSQARSEESDEEIVNEHFDLDKNKHWSKVVEYANNLPAETNFRSSMFKTIKKCMERLREAIVAASTVEELQDHLATRGDPVITMCELLQERSDVDKRRNTTEFSDGGFRVLINAISKLISARKNSLLGSQDTVVPGMIFDLTLNVIEYSDFIREKGVFSQAARHTIGAMRPFTKELDGELKRQEQTRRWEAFKDEYRKSHQALQEQEQRKMERFKRLNAEEKRYSPRVIATSPTRLSLPIHTAATRVDSDRTWTTEMDEALVDGLHKFRNRPFPQRYLGCLSYIPLQNLSQELIRSRALTCQPSLKAWYEEQGQAVPAWVTSIQ